MDVTIELKKMRFYARHGVMEQERAVGNDFEVTVEVTYDGGEAAETDDVASALNYAEIAGAVKEVMAEPAALLERVALSIRERLTGRFPQIKSGRVKVTKVMPPIPAIEMEGASVSLSW